MHVSRGNYAGRNWDQKYDSPPSSLFFSRFGRRPFCAYTYIYLSCTFRHGGVFVTPVRRLSGAGIVINGNIFKEIVT